MDAGLRKSQASVKNQYFFIYCLVVQKLYINYFVKNTSDTQIQERLIRQYPNPYKITERSVKCNETGSFWIS